VVGHQAGQQRVPAGGRRRPTDTIMPPSIATVACSIAGPSPVHTRTSVTATGSVPGEIATPSRILRPSATGARAPLGSTHISLLLNREVWMSSICDPSGDQDARSPNQVSWVMLAGDPSF